MYVYVCIVFISLQIGTQGHSRSFILHSVTSRQGVAYNIAM